jgi:hypothetical protein
LGIWKGISLFGDAGVIVLYDQKTANFPTAMPESLQQEAQAILPTLASIPFQDCIALSKEFRSSSDEGWYLHCQTSRPWNPLHGLSPVHWAITLLVVKKLYFGHSLKN